MYAVSSTVMSCVAVVIQQDICNMGHRVDDHQERQTLLLGTLVYSGQKTEAKGKLCYACSQSISRTE